MRLTQPPRIRFYNKEKKMPSVQGRAIIISNHTWWMDPIVLILTFWRRRLYSLAAVEVLGPSKLATCIRRSMLFVDVDRSKLDIRSFNNCIDLLRNEKCLLIFPEGRFVFEDEIQEFKGGTALMALQTDAPIYPVYLFGRYKLFKPIDIAIGDPIDVKSLIGETLDAESIKRINKLMRESVSELKMKLENELSPEEILERDSFKTAKRKTLAEKAEDRARAWRKAQEKKDQSR